MALVSDGFWMRVTLVDNGNNRTIKTYQLRAALIATAITDGATIRAALAAVTDSVISAYSVAERFHEDTFVFPASGIQNEDKASISAVITGAKTGNLKIPAPIPAMFQDVTGGAANIVDTTNALLITYTDVFKSGNEAFISDGDDLITLSSGKRISAKSNFG